MAPLGTGPFQLVQYQKDSTIRFRAFPHFWGEKGGMPERAARVDNLVFAITPDAGGAAGQAARQRMPDRALSEPGRSRGDARHRRASRCWKRRSPPRACCRSAPTRSRSATSGCARRWPWRSTTTAWSRRCSRAAARRPARWCRRALWGHDDTLAAVPVRSRQGQGVAGRGRATRTASRSICGPSRWSRAYMPNGRRAAEMIQADWAKIGVTAKIVTYEWGEFLRRRRAGEADIAMNGGTWDYPDPSELTATETCDAIADGSNVSHWCDQAIHRPDRTGPTSSPTRRRAPSCTSRRRRCFMTQLPSMMFADVQRLRRRARQRAGVQAALPRRPAIRRRRPGEVGGPPCNSRFRPGRRSRTTCAARPASSCRSARSSSTVPTG